MNPTAVPRLSDLCDLAVDQVDPRETPSLPYLGLEHIAPGRFEPIGYGKAGDVASSKHLFRQGDLLYGKLRPYLDKAVLADRDGLCSTELLVLRPREQVDARFLLGIVHSPDFVTHAMAGVRGVQHPRTAWPHLRLFEVPEVIPGEQTRVGQLLWSTQRAIRACEATIESAGTLKRAAMRELFTRGLRDEAQKETEIGRAPNSWTVEELKERFTVVSGGTPARGNAAYWTGGTIPWVKTTEINYTVISETQERITPEGLANSAARLLPSGTVLMAMYGQGVTRARVGVLGIEAACNQACAGLLPKDDTLDPRFLYHFLTFRYEAIRNLAHGGQQQNLNMDIVRALPLVYPDNRDEQREIVEILDAIDQKIDLHMRKQALLEELFKALLHKLMTGEIRVSDLDLAALENEGGK